MRIALLCLLLSGCVTYTHPNKDEAEYHRDIYECMRDGAAVRDAGYAAFMRNLCMKTKGYSF